VTAIYDPRAQRELAAARAERIRARAALQAERERLALEAERDRVEAERRARVEAERAERRRARVEARAARRTARRAALAGAAAAVRARVPALVGAVAIGAPMLIAWRGQLAFGRDVMDLGTLAIAVPVALEGAVLYTAHLTHRAVSEGLPAGRYRAMTWALALVAASMNLWHHGSDLQVGVVYALASLIGIMLWELTTGLRGHVRSGRSGAEIRAAAWRRIRYPRLSWAAASIRAARGPECSPDEAWVLAWRDRYGVGPDASRRDRRLAELIVRHTARAERRAARRGELGMVGGVILGRPLPPVVTTGVTAASEGSVTEPVQAADTGGDETAPARALEAVPEPATQTATAAVTIRPVAAPRPRRAVAAESRRRRRTTAVVRRSADEHRAELARLLAAGELPADASVRQIRRALGCAQGTAVALAAELAGGAA